ncbi:MAG: rod shape-determining protein MreD [Deferrisomatales bacterium]|nr:rod shape-determining protein MreD [Deferrisomatales bacterium]
MRAQAAWWGALLAGLALQTTLFPLFLTDPWRPDLTRALVLWVALTGAPRGGAVLAFSAGLLLDAASGAPLGFGPLLRLSLYAAARPFRGIFFDDRPLLLLPFATLGPALEAAVAGTMSWFAFRAPLGLNTLASGAWAQALVDALCVPLVFVALELATGRRPRLEVGT